MPHPKNWANGRASDNFAGTAKQANVSEEPVRAGVSTKSNTPKSNYNTIFNPVGILRGQVVLLALESSHLVFPTLHGKGG